MVVAKGVTACTQTKATVDAETMSLFDNFLCLSMDETSLFGDDTIVKENLSRERASRSLSPGQHDPQN